MLKKTELYIEEKQVDLYGDEAFLLNFNVADITDISAKASSYSKELDIPATKINNQIFSHLFDVSSEGYFNPISKKRTELYIDGVCVMRGYFKLNSMTIIDNEYVTYHGVIFEDGVNFIGALGDLELENLYIPFTGTTAFTGSTLSTIKLDGYTGTNFRAIPSSNSGGITVPAGRIYKGAMTNLTMGSGVGYIYLDTTVLHSAGLGGPTPFNLTSGMSESSQYLTAIMALQNCWVGFNTNYFKANRPVFITAYKVMPTTAYSGGYEFLAYTSTVSVAANTVSNLAIPTILLQAGEGVYIHIVDQATQGNLPGGVPPPPLAIDPLTKFEGTILNQVTGTVSPTLINESYILNNILVATGATNSDICFPFIDYNQTFPYSATNVANSATSQSTPNRVDVRFEDLRPAVFVKRVWDEIFKQSGFRYKSKFLDTNSDIFNKLIVIGGIDEDEISTPVFESYLTGTTSYYTLQEPLQDTNIPPGATGTAILGYLYQAFLFGGEVPNVASNDWYITTRNVSYTELFKKSFSYNGLIFSGPDYGYMLKALVAGKYKVEANISGLSLPVLYGGSNAPNSKQGLVYTLRIDTMKGGSVINDPSTFTVPSTENWKQKKIVTFKRDLLATNQPFTLNLNETIDLERGEICRVTLLASAEAQMDPGQTDNTAYASQTRLYYGLNNTYVRYSRCGSFMGANVSNLAQMLPRGFKQSDFIIGLAKMFNLYFEPDKQDPKTLWIEPRDVYYEDGRVLNWEKKLDYSKAIEIDILSHDQPKNFVFKHMDDSSDYYTEQFKKFNSNNLTFGAYKFTSPNEYVTETEEIELPFAAGYLQKISATDQFQGVTGTTAQPIIITKIIDPDSQKPGYKGDASDWRKEPRILYYGGKINLPNEIYRSYTLNFIGSLPDGSSYDIEMPYYPYAGHYDKPLQPTIDINFFTDTHYLPTTFWNNTLGSTTEATSSTSVNLATLQVGQSVAMTLNFSTNVPNFALNQYVDKYIYCEFGTGQWFVGKVTSFPGNTIVVMTVVQVQGTLTGNSWVLKLQNVVMKYNLFNTFYKNQVVELTDQTARLMTCYMYLTPTDIANFRFNDIVYTHKEYWRVNKIIDYDTSSDVNQTTKVELIKILRADTSALIDYTAGGYLGIAGGTGGGITTGTGTIGGTTPSVVALRPMGGGGVAYTTSTIDQLNLQRNSIVQDENNNVPTFFNQEVNVIDTGNELLNIVKNQNTLIYEVLAIAEDKPIGEAITYTDANAGLIDLPTRFTQVYYDVIARDKLFLMNLETTTTDGYLIHFDTLNDTTTTFIQIVNPNSTSNEVFVLNEDSSVTAKFDATKNIWVISKA